MSTIKHLALAASLIAGLQLTSIVGAQANTFTDLQKQAPRSQIFTDLERTAPRSAIFTDIERTAPRSDGVFGTLKGNAP